MKDRLVKLAAGGQLASGGDAGDRVWLEVTTSDGASATVALTEGELLMALEALAMVNAELCGARSDSVARGVNRTLRNRTAAARERRREPNSSEAAA